jgi:hypothetical protein
MTGEVESQPIRRSHNSKVIDSNLILATSKTKDLREGVSPFLLALKRFSCIMGYYVTVTWPNVHHRLRRVPSSEAEVLT